MCDRELLELAAKAVGYRLWGGSSGPWSPYEKGLLLADAVTMWRPLEDDGQALRLAVRLSLLVDVDARVRTEHQTDVMITGRADVFREIHGGDPCAATRRAIVRAAAEIGKAIQEPAHV